MPAVAILNVSTKYVNRIPPRHFIVVQALNDVLDVPTKYDAAITAGDLEVRLMLNETRRIGPRPSYARFAEILVADVTDPAVVITGPTSATTYFTNAATLTVSGTSSDLLTIVAVTWANAAGAGTSGVATTANGYAAWSAAGIALTAGDNVITVTSRDGSGNEATDVITVTRDNVNPVVTILVPADPTIGIVTPTILVSGTSSDASGVASVTYSNSLGGSGVATTGDAYATWSIAAVALTIGVNVVTVTATDLAGNTAVDTVTITRDS